MEKQFECIKIKDGLYIGNRIVACVTYRIPQDLQFLLINKFGYVVNCAVEVPNLYQQHGIKYTKFKIKQQKVQNIFGQDFKRLKKVKKVISQAQQQGLCCLVHCSQGGNRSLVLITAYLMDRFKWRLRKTLEYLQSKSVAILLTDSNIQELTNFQSILSKEFKLSHLWVANFIDEEQQLIAKTFNNTTKQKHLKEVKPSSPVQTQQKQEVIVEKVKKRVLWLDKIQKEQKKQKRRLLVEKTKQEKKQVEKQRQKIDQKAFKKDSKAHNLIIPKDKAQLVKRSKKKVSTDLQPEMRSRIQEVQMIKILKKQEQQKGISSLKKQQIEAREAQSSSQQNLQKEAEAEEQDKKVYKLTINNYINPSINIIKPPADKKKKPKVQKKEKDKDKDKDKFNRTYSEKQAFKKLTFFEKPLSKEKQIPREKRNAGYTPIRSRKERKSQN